MTEQAIAYSTYSNTQVLLTIVSPDDLMSSKIEALLDRKEIRDAYDLEFLYRRGAGKFEGIDKKQLEMIRSIINSFKITDFKAVLGNLLPPDERKRLESSRFNFLEGAIAEGLTK